MTDRFSASVAGRHMACPASANLDLAIPGFELPPEDRAADNAANRGTHKHELLDPIMRLPRADIDGFAKIFRYVADLRATRRFKVLVEQKVTATWLKSEPTTTVDLGLYTQDELHVIDYKWGKIKVEVTDNVQMLYYAASIASLAPKAKGVRLHILQPPCDNFESWYVDTNQLQQFMDDARAAEAKVLAKDLTFSPGDHCMFCPANPHSRASIKGTIPCPTMMQLLYPRVVDEDEILAL